MENSGILKTMKRQWNIEDFLISFIILFSQIDRENPLFGLIPRIKITDKQSYTQSATRHYDTVGFACG
jgi:hypothetical protein